MLPVDPVAPVLPDGPVTPVPPELPVAPLSPVDPVLPEGPVDPVDPVRPSLPVKPKGIEIFSMAGRKFYICIHDHNGTFNHTYFTE